MRAEREAELGAKQARLSDKKYGVVFADPDWRGLDRSASNHVRMSSLDEIKSLDVPSIAADDCVLFLWATVPMLGHAFDVMEAWGFAYKTQIIWVKTKTGVARFN